MDAKNLESGVLRQAVVWLGGEKIVIGARNIESADFARLVASVANQPSCRAVDSRCGRTKGKRRSRA